MVAQIPLFEPCPFRPMPPGSKQDEIIKHTSGLMGGEPSPCTLFCLPPPAFGVATTPRASAVMLVLPPLPSPCSRVTISQVLRTMLGSGASCATP